MTGVNLKAFRRWSDLSFLAIADVPDTYTEQRLHTSLHPPHWPMEQFCLSPSDIDNIVDYVKSLGFK